MSGVDLRLPVIAMDGAVLYDAKENRCLETEPLPPDISLRAEKIIAEMGCHCFVNALYDSTIVIYYGELQNDAEKEVFRYFEKIAVQKLYPCGIPHRKSGDTVSSGYCRKRKSRCFVPCFV